jgi:xanthine dehydrogenase accessory factor
MSIVLNQLVIGIKGAGEMASAVAWRLFKANFRQIFMMDVDQPLAVRRKVSFCEALFDETVSVEGVAAQQVAKAQQIESAWAQGKIAVLADPKWKALAAMQPMVVVDAIIAKKNIGTTLSEAPLVIGLGPGFCAPVDVHVVIETNRGHNLGRIITTGSADENTGIPGSIGGYAKRRVLRAPVAGQFDTQAQITDLVEPGDTIGTVGNQAVQAEIGGVLRGLIRGGMQVSAGLKLGDIDPRGEPDYCSTISDKARAIGGTVLEAILRKYNV